MVKVWDDRLKRLAGILPDDFVKWLLPEAHLIRVVSLELKTLTRTVNTDTLFEVRLHGKKALVHIEFQKRANKKMAQRVWEYNVLATLAHNCPVYSFIIYLTPEGSIPESPLIWGLPECELVHVFHFVNIKLWELPVEALKEQGLKGLLPLCILAKDGAQRNVARDIIENVKTNKELLALALTLASMVLTSEADQHWLEGEVAMLEDILRDTWLYQKIFREGGAKEQEGITQKLRLEILNDVQIRFPDIIESARQKVEAIHDPMLLHKISIRIIMSQSAQEVENILKDTEEI